MHLEIRELVKRFERHRALDGVSVQIEAGQIVAVLGLNGAGKSSLLRCCAGLLSPDSGSVYYDGVELTRDDLPMRRRFLFFGDQPALFRDQSILRNIAIVLRLYDRDGVEAEDRVIALLEEFDLLPLARCPLSVLSRGQAYKAALVALLAADPEIWLLDEPFASGMDSLGLAAFRRHAREAVGRGRTILYSTQLLDLAERLSDRVLILHDGRLRAFDTVERLTQNGDLTDLFRAMRDGND